MNKKIFASLMLLLATLIWGLSYSIQSISANNLGPYTIVFFKGLGGLFLIPLLFILKRRIVLKDILLGLLIGVACYFGCLFQQRGIELSTVSKASFITVLYIVFVPLMEIFLGKKPKMKIWIAIVVALLGLYFLCISGSVTLNIGDLYLLIGSVFFGLQIILVDKNVHQCDPLVLSAFAQIGVSVLAFINMSLFEKPAMSNFLEAIIPIFFMVFISGALAQTIQVVYQKDVEASLASLLMSFESVFGALSGWLLLNQALSFREIIGCLLVFIAILIAE